MVENRIVNFGKDSIARKLKYAIEVSGFAENGYGHPSIPLPYGGFPRVHSHFASVLLDRGDMVAAIIGSGGNPAR